MTEQQPRFITRPYHRSLNQQITAIFQAAAKWSAETLPLADQAQLLLSTDRTVAKEIKNLHELYGQPPHHAFALVPAQNRDIVAAFAVLAHRSHDTVDIRHLTVSPPYREIDIKSVLLSPIDHLARQGRYRYIISTVYPHQTDLINAFQATEYDPIPLDRESTLMTDLSPQTFQKEIHHDGVSRPV